MWDNDGDFLLIEAAYSLPRWLKPESATNRVGWLGGLGSDLAWAGSMGMVNWQSIARDGRNCIKRRRLGLVPAGLNPGKLCSSSASEATHRRLANKGSSSSSFQSQCANLRA